MGEYFPFTVRFIGESEQMYQLLADFEAPHLSSYKLLFDRYSSSNAVFSLVDIVVLIIEETAPNLLDCMDFDEEGYLLDMHVDSKESLQTFVTNVCPVFQSTTLLEDYTKRTAND